MLQLYIDLSSSRLACREIQRIQRIQRIQLYSYTRYTAYSTIQPPSVVCMYVVVVERALLYVCMLLLLLLYATNQQISPYFNPTYTRTGWIGQPPAY